MKASELTNTLEMIAIVKSREIQRGMLAELRGDDPEAVSHFLAAAHLDLVLATDYAEMGADELALRSLLGAATCFWRGHEKQRVRSILSETLGRYPARSRLVHEIERELGILS